MTDKELLQQYANELKLVCPLTIEGLIASHRYLFKIQSRSCEEIRQERAKIYKETELQARDNTWVRWQDIKTMSIQELIDRIAE